MNAKHFADYEVTNGFHCGGHDIRSWDDGSSTNYGSFTGVSNCKRMCNMHVECAGFIYLANNGRCSYWRRGPLKPIRYTGHTCHKKLNGRTIIYV